MSNTALPHTALPHTAPPDTAPHQTADGADEPNTDPDDDLRALREAVAALDGIALAERPAAFDDVNTRLVAALRAVDED